MINGAQAVAEMGVIMKCKIIGPIIESIGAKEVMVAAVHNQEKQSESH
jgi:hypothetical protein